MSPYETEFLKSKLDRNIIARYGSPYRLELAKKLLHTNCSKHDLIKNSIKPRTARGKKVQNYGKK